MKLTVLIDNATLIDRYFRAEPGLCLHIEDHGRTFLLDCGYSGLFLENAQKLGISLSRLDGIILSHGHLDHTWGLISLIRHMTELRMEGQTCIRPDLIAHPQALTAIRFDQCPNIGSLLETGQLARHFELRLSSSPLRLGEKLFYLGEIPRVHAFEHAEGIGIKDGESGPDMVPDDTALVYQGQNGLVIITGCAHAGICNIVEQAMTVTGEHRIADIIGGLHLLNASTSRLEATVNFLRALRPKMLSPCHCTDLNAKIALNAAAPLREVGVGLVVKYD